MKITIIESKSGLINSILITNIKIKQIKRRNELMKNGLKKFEVTFTNTNKQHPLTRTITVEAKDDLHATNLINSQFGSFTYDKKLMMSIPSSKKIVVDKVVEVKDVKEEK
jgi:hypothetical protein